MFFDFHNHKINSKGIYNLYLGESIPKKLFSIGLHPKFINENFDEDFKKIKELSLLENCFAIGECGLDSTVETEEKIQEKVYKAQINWANEIKKPIIIHCVRRFPEIINLKKVSSVPMIIHGFNKKKAIADELLCKGFYLSFGKAALQNLSLQHVIKDFPIEKLFLETDDADFDIAELYKKVSELKQISIENLQDQIFENLEKIKEA